MKKHLVIILIFIFIPKLLKAAEFTWNGSSIVTKVHEIILPDGIIDLSFTTKGGISLITSKYAISTCSGLRTDKDQKLIELRVICSLEINDGYQIWTELRRDKGESIAGVGKLVVVNATGPYRALIDQECIYAVSYFNEFVFSKIQCQISNDILNQLNR